MQLIGIQLDIAWEQPAANHQRASQMLAAADVKPGAMVVLPEMFPTGYSMNTAATVEGPDGPTRQFYTQLARRYQCTVVGGLVSCSDKAGCGRNEAVVVSPPGEQLALYCKMRPMRLGGEIDHYDRGESITTFQWGELTVCPFICYDLRFPELFRAGARAGAQMFIVIASWPSHRQAHWTALLRARAIENQAYVVGVNRCGTDPQFRYAGGSVCFDPHGTAIAELDDKPGLLTAPIDPKVVIDWRQQFPALLDLS